MSHNGLIAVAASLLVISFWNMAIASPVAPSLTCDLHLKDMNVVTNKGLICASLRFAGMIENEGTRILQEKQIAISYSVLGDDTVHHTILDDSECMEDGQLYSTGDLTREMVYLCGSLAQSSHASKMIVLNEVLTKGPFSLTGEQMNPIYCSLSKGSNVSPGSFLPAINVFISDPMEDACHDIKQTCYSIAVGDGGVYSCPNGNMHISSQALSFGTGYASYVPNSNALCVQMHTTPNADISRVRLVSSPSHRISFKVQGKLNGDDQPTVFTVTVKDSVDAPCQSLDLAWSENIEYLCGSLPTNITVDKFESIEPESKIAYEAQTKDGRIISGASKLTRAFSGFSLDNVRTVQEIDDNVCKEQCGEYCIPSCMYWIKLGNVVCYNGARNILPWVENVTEPSTTSIPNQKLPESRPTEVMLGGQPSDDKSSKDSETHLKVNETNPLSEVKDGGIQTATVKLPGLITDVTTPNATKSPITTDTATPYINRTHATVEDNQSLNAPTLETEKQDAEIHQGKDRATSISDTTDIPTSETLSMQNIEMNPVKSGEQKSKTSGTSITTWIMLIVSKFATINIFA